MDKFSEYTSTTDEQQFGMICHSCERKRCLRTHWQFHNKLILMFLVNIWWNSVIRVRHYKQICTPKNRCKKIGKSPRFQNGKSTKGKRFSFLLGRTESHQQVKVRFVVEWSEKRHSSDAIVWNHCLVSYLINIIRYKSQWLKNLSQLTFSTG